MCTLCCCPGINVAYSVYQAVRVANLIGAGYAKLAKKSSRTGLAIGVVLGLIEGGLLALFKDRMCFRPLVSYELTNISPQTLANFLYPMPLLSNSWPRSCP